MTRIPNAVGVRELRQNLSKHLRRVEAGQSLRVTERGRVVAILSPVVEKAEAVERLLGAGRVRAARLDLASLPSTPGARVKKTISRALAEQRAEGPD